MSKANICSFSLDTTARDRAAEITQHLLSLGFVGFHVFSMSNDAHYAEFETPPENASALPRVYTLRNGSVMDVDYYVRSQSGDRVFLGPPPE